MYDLISIGNISIDLYFKGDALTFQNNRFQLAVGGKYFADHFYTGIGGGGVNIAIGASKFGLNTAVLGTVGENPFKEIINQMLDDHKVSSKLCHFESNYYNLSSIFLTDKGEKTIVHYTTPHKNILRKASSIKHLVEAKAVFMGNLPDVSLTEREITLNLCKKNHILTVLNLGVEDCRRPKHQLENLLKKADILILNGHEFAELVKAQYKDIHFHEDVVEWYLPNLADKMVVVTEGKTGSYAYNQHQVYHQDAEPAEKILDSTGAGDAYAAGFIAEYSKSKSIEKSMEEGSKYAAKILAKIGAN